MPTLGAILSTIARGDWAELECLFDPEVHWTTAVEEQLHGRAAVIDRLRRDPPPGPPAYHQFRDGRIVRWIDKSG